MRNPRHTVVRTSLNGGSSPHARGFNEEMCAAWKAGKALRLFHDEYRCPIVAEITAQLLWRLAQTKEGGIFHLAGGERLSRLEIGQIVAARHPELNPRIESSSLREYAGASRPPDCSLDCTKIERLLTCKMPKLTEWLQDNPTAKFSSLSVIAVVAAADMSICVPELQWSFWRARRSPPMIAAKSSPDETPQKCPTEPPSSFFYDPSRQCSCPSPFIETILPV